MSQERRKGLGRRDYDRKIVALNLNDDGLRDETIQHLEAMLARAKQGQFVGIAYVILKRNSRYEINYAGAAELYPEITSSLLYQLKQELSSLVIRYIDN